MDPRFRGDDAQSVIPAKAGIQPFFMHSGEPKDHGIFAQDDSASNFYFLISKSGPSCTSAPT